MHAMHRARTLGIRIIATTTVGALVGLGLAGVGTPPAAAAQAPVHMAPAAVGSLATPAAAVATPASPQGPLVPDGRRVVACSAGCDLWAQAGSWAPGVAGSVPVWGFTAAAADPVAAVGPTLLVGRGSTVTITLHNNLPGAQALSLAIPGMTGLTSDLTGVDVGGTRSYTFTAGRSGTYLYEAGHTAQGARQSLMGLVGALVVSGDVSTSGRPTTYSTDASAFDDEAVLVLSEIDPAFNADPLGFDLRLFAPKYRLLNGKTFPQTNVIATDKARTVLLRYVNAGAVNHPMELLGVEQTVIGQDGHASPAPEQVASTTITPGQAVDALVTMPDTEAKYVLAESAGQLNDNSSTDVAGQQAFGGMLTFLDTSAAPPTTDIFGPISSAVTATPSTVTIHDSLTVTASFSDAKAGGSNVDSAEYAVDDPTLALGSGSQLSTATGQPSVTWTAATSTVPVTSLTRLDPSTGMPVLLAAGRHVVYVRAHDASGNWGPIGSAVFNLKQTGPVTTAATAGPSPTNATKAVVLSATGDDSAFNGTVVSAEFYLDNDPGQGSGTPLTLNRQATVVAETATIGLPIVAGLTEGPHKVFIRSRDNLGLWGDPAAADLVIDTTGPTFVTGNATPTPNNGRLGSSVDPAQMQVLSTFTDTGSRLVAAEGFVDNANGISGKGLVFVARDGVWDSGLEQTYGLVPLSEFTGYAEGAHVVYVHAKDAAGNWGMFSPVSFTVDKSGPVITAGPTVSNNGGTLSATATDNLSTVSAAEWFTGTDPGVGRAAPMAVTASGLTASLAAPLTLPSGSYPFTVRAKDLAGNWGPATTVTLTVSRPVIFADGFETAPLVPPWSSAVGLVARSTAAALTGTAGLAVTMNASTSPAYVQDLRPAAETTYHTSMQFRRNTLAPGAQTVTLLRTLNAAGSQVSAVQYRRIVVNTVATYQVRLVVNTTAGTTNTVWLTVPDSVLTIQVDWSSAGSATATLTVNGTASTLSGLNTAAQKVETVRLGIVQTTGAISGTAYVDSFTSTR